MLPFLLDVWGREMVCYGKVSFIVLERMEVFGIGYLYLRLGGDESFYVGI